ncbi:MAG TPA: hypothetical protein V6D31_02000 [Candidatus Sericytochromatia bacterium]|jgi:hypothetical protein
MNLDKQIEYLIKNAPQDGTPELMAAIAPILKQLATQLRHSEYFISQTPDQGWIMTTLSNRTQPDIEKNVVYAFPTLKDAKSFQTMTPQLIAVKIPVTHILFQLVAMDTVDSLVFFETSGNLASGAEVRRADLQNLIQTQLQQYRAPKSSKLPPDIA